MHKIILALGSNVGNKEDNIKKAIKLLSKKITDIQRAKNYTSRAVGYTNQDDFINTAIGGKTNLSPIQLLALTQSIEKKVGRIFRFHWGPREVDIDIIFYDNQIIDLENLQIPHPRMNERDFVLRPLLDIEPAFKHPSTFKTVARIYGCLDKKDYSIIE